MNALHREIHEGEVVVIEKSYFKPEYQALESRLFRVTGGFGMSDNTTGSKVFGYYLEDYEYAMIDSLRIDPKETADYQETHKEN